MICKYKHAHKVSTIYQCFVSELIMKTAKCRTNNLFGVAASSNSKRHIHIHGAATVTSITANQMAIHYTLCIKQLLHSGIAGYTKV